MTDTTTTIQGSAQWFEIRVGKATGSRISDILARGKSGPSASRANYAAQLVAERLTGIAQEGFSSPAMERGKEVEADARKAYSFRTGHVVVEHGFADHPTIPMSGASCDGLIGDDGVVEFKCPGTAQQIATLRGEIIAKSYRDQMLWGMACTGRSFCDFVSFDPRLPESMSLAIKRVHLDAERLMEVENEVRIFLAEVDETVADLKRRYEPIPLAEALRGSLG